MKQFYIYIMASASGVLYIGVTSNLLQRVYQHKMKMIPGFTHKYNCTKLVYFEEYSDAESAFNAEKRMKKWHRWKKEKLINKMNPEWNDLAADWYEDEIFPS